MAEQFSSIIDPVESVEDVIASCMNLDSPRSFFLYAGAGSGKTRTLVAAVRDALEDSRRRLQTQHQVLAIITYTNAASDEIKRRLEFDPIVEISTIHSFSWELVKKFQRDIREWLRSKISSDLADLVSKSSRPGSKAEEDRVHKIDRAQRRLAGLDGIERFTYNPSGDNSTRDSLSHAEVISIAASFLKEKPMMREILVGRVPILFIDESQDTNREFLESLFEVEAASRGRFALGLFGDMMQRIYNDGKEDLERSIPQEWARPEKRVNYRSATRIIELINRIRSDVDTHVQTPGGQAVTGTVRLFLVRGSSVETPDAEGRAARRMRLLTGDPGWEEGSNIGGGIGSQAWGVKRLILEHHMAAKRLGFEGVFSALYSLERQRTSLLNGRIAGLQFFLRHVVPLMAAVNRGDEFAVARIVREGSPLLFKENLRRRGKQIEGALSALAEARAAVDSLAALWAEGRIPTLHDVAANLHASQLFLLPEEVGWALDTGNDLTDEGHQVVAKESSAWESCLKSSFTEIENYANYVQDRSPFATHQGVKGLEFPRVMVIVSDEEARGFMFSYDKLLGVKDPSAADLRNREGSRDTSIDRTRRLFYVTCSRAEKDLAIVAYSEAPEAVRSYAISREWFQPDEVEIL